METTNNFLILEEAMLRAGFYQSEFDVNLYHKVIVDFGKITYYAVDRIIIVDIDKFKHEKFMGNIMHDISTIEDFNTILKLSGVPDSYFLVKPEVEFKDENASINLN